MDDQQGFVVGVSSGGRPIEAPRDYCFVVDHGELVVEFVATGKAVACFYVSEKKKGFR